MLTNANTSATFVANKFCCKSCDYTSSRKNDWVKHLSTTKHKNANKMLTLAFVSKSNKMTFSQSPHFLTINGHNRGIS